MRREYTSSCCASPLPGCQIQTLRCSAAPSVGNRVSSPTHLILRTKMSSSSPSTFIRHPAVTW